MINLVKFFADSVTFRPVSMFAADIDANKEGQKCEIKGKKVCLIRGAVLPVSSFIKTVLRFSTKSVMYVDLNENGMVNRKFFTTLTALCIWFSVGIYAQGVENTPPQTVRTPL